MIGKLSEIRQLIFLVVSQFEILEHHKDAFGATQRTTKDTKKIFRQMAVSRLLNSKTYKIGRAKPARMTVGREHKGKPIKMGKLRNLPELAKGNNLC